MKKLQVSWLVTGLFLIVASFASYAQAIAFDQAKFVAIDKPIAGEYIVVLKSDAARLAGETRSRNPEIRAVAESISSQYRVKLQRSFTHVLRGFVIVANERTITNLMLDERVAFIEENGRVSISQTTQTNATWGLDRIDQRDRPLNSTYVYDTAASNVRAYIIDTGILASHTQFGGRVLSGFSAINDGRGSNDCNGHGTHVAGTVGATTYGVAKQVRLVPVRVLDCQGSGSNAGVIAGMDWVAANRVLPAVANMSLGGGASTATDNAVANMRNAGVTVVVAAGNENQNACNVSPARAAAAFAVGSTTNTDVRSSFSNFGTCVDIFAPGSSITSAWHTSNSATNSISGTSMASPHVAGAAALFLGQNPGASPAQVESFLVNNASTNKLSSINTGSPNRLLYSRLGSGGGGGTTPPPSGPTELGNGVAVGSLSGASGSEAFFTIDVPQGASNLNVSISGGSGDADLYVRFGSPPTESTYDCRPFLNGNSETCTFSSPQAGTHHVMLRGFSAYSGVSLVASFDEPSSAPCTNCTQFSGSLSATGDSDVQPDGTWFQSDAGTQSGWLEGPTSADFDLELNRWNGSSWVVVASGTSANSEETVQYNGTAGFYYWRIKSFSGSGSYDFWMRQP
ncbi:MAG: S8 family serine peptidase [Wenzhouxiangellaceae bacterium]|nr:S8 family serine peptidase [Wenzhouxiangellaceae bacterium]